MRVMLVAPSDVTAVGGGLERHVLSLARLLARRGHRVTLAVPAREAGRSPLGEGAELVRLRALFPHGGGLYRAAATHPQFPDPAFALGLRQLMGERPPDVVHSHGSALFSVATALRGRRVPWVHTLHDYSFLCPKATLWKLPETALCQRPMTPACLPCHWREEPKGPIAPLRAAAALAGLAAGRGLLAGPDLLIAVSRFVAEVHRRYDPAIGGRTTVIPNFLDEDERAVRTPPVGLPEGFLLFAGSALPHKGLSVLLEAHRRLRADLPLVAMALSPTRHLNRLRRKASDGVIFYRSAPHPQVMAAWERCLLGVVPSLWAEPCPTTALEAMSRGKPVVASAVGGLPEVVADGETGILVLPGDAEALREGIEALLQDEALRQRMGEAARERFQRLFTGERVIPQIEAAYHRARG